MRKLSFQVLLIEDDLTIINPLKALVPNHWTMLARRDLDSDTQRRFFHCAFVDLHLTGDTKTPNGLDVIKALSQTYPATEVYAISGKDDLPLMERALEMGARGFIRKPLNPERVLNVLERTEALFQLRELQESPQGRETQWIGSSHQSQELLRKMASLKGSPNPILISGETGTGKDVVARILNQQEEARPFVAVNVAAVPENLFEAEFFGSVKGSFTGADVNRTGLVEAAAHGDLFLDEIEALPMDQQAKLLRFLDSGEYRRVGGRENLKVSVRIIAASNEDLKSKVSQGLFREDLLYRIQGTELRIAPLRERAQDIADLAKFFLEHGRSSLGKSWSSEAIDFLQKHSWPGNVRELRRCVEHVLLSSPLPIIRSTDLQPILNLTQSTPVSSKADLSLGLDNLLKSYEAMIIEQSLKECPTVDDAADRLQVSRSSLYKKIKEYGIKT